MRPRAEVGIFTLTVKADGFFFRKIFDEFDLIGLILSFMRAMASSAEA